MRVPLLLLATLLMPCLTQGQDLYDAAHSRRFAAYLYQSGSYGPAAREYERLLFFVPGNDSLRAQILSAYRRGGLYAEGLRRGQRMLLELPPPGAAPLLEYGKLLIVSDSLTQADSLLRRFLGGHPEAAHLRLGAACLRADWPLARELHSSLPDKRLQMQYEPLLTRAESIRYCSPALAASLSVLVPGLGKAYARQWKDGLIALVFVGSTAFQAWRSYERRGLSSPGFWIYGSLAAGFYLGNIFGSHRAAKRYNDLQNQSVIRDARSVLERAF
jgi:hypothetical protein